MGMHGCALVCELVVTLISFLELMSGYKNSEAPGAHHSMTPAKRDQQAAAIIASLVTTLFVFALTVIGAGNSISGASKAAASAKVVVKRISAATTVLSTRNGNSKSHISSHGHHSEDDASIELEVGAGPPDVF